MKKNENIYIENMSKSARMNKMEEPTIGQILVQDPLSRISRSERRNLLGISIITITIVKTGLIPTKISALGIEFSPANRLALLGILFLVVIYFLLAFLIYSISDFLDWRLRLNNARAKIYIEFEKSRVSKDISIDREREILFRSGSITRLMITPISFLRAIFEFLLPIIVGIYAIILLQ
jgi:hypothetical protein